MTSIDTDVHTEHCCAEHGCKYSDKDCSVVTKQLKQSYPCEACVEREDHLSTQEHEFLSLVKKHLSIEVKVDRRGDWFHIKLMFKPSDPNKEVITISDDYVSLSELEKSDYGY